MLFGVTLANSSERSSGIASLHEVGCPRISLFTARQALRRQGRTSTEIAEMPSEKFGSGMK